MVSAFKVVLYVEFWMRVLQREILLTLEKSPAFLDNQICLGRSLSLLVALVSFPTYWDVLSPFYWMSITTDAILSG